jgi:hypothetical protein
VIGSQLDRVGSFLLNVDNVITRRRVDLMVVVVAGNQDTHPRRLHTLAEQADKLGAAQQRPVQTLTIRTIIKARRTIVRVQLLTFRQLQSTVFALVRHFKWTF